MVFLVSELSSALHFRLQLLLEASKRFDEVFLLTSIDCQIPFEPPHNFKIINVNATRSLSIFGDILYFLQILRLLKNIGPVDVIHTFSAKPNIYGILAAKLLGIPKRVISITGLGRVFFSDVETSSLLRMCLISMYKISFRASTDIWFQNKSNFEFLQSHNAIPKYVKCHAIYGSGVDLEYFSYTCRTKMKNIRRQFLIDETEILVLCVSRLLRSKGVHLLLKAVPLLDKNIRVILIGEKEDGRTKEYLEYEDVEVSFLKTKHIYIRSSDDIRSFLCHCDIALLPSFGEGMSKFLLEAISMEKFIVTSKAPGCRDLFDFDICPGETIELQSIEISQKLNALSKLGRIGLRKPENRALAEKYFDVKTVNSQLMTIYFEEH